MQSSPYGVHINFPYMQALQARDRGQRLPLMLSALSPSLYFHPALQKGGVGEMSGKAGGKAKPLKKPKSAAKDLDESDLEFQKKKKEEAAQLKALKEKAAGKGGFAKVKGSK